MSDLELTEKKKRLEEIEKIMSLSDFWSDKNEAQKIIREYNDLKAEDEGGGKYDSGNAVITIFAGAGGADSEDFAFMLFGMYQAYISNKGWTMFIVHKNENEHGGFRNITFEINGKGVYGTLKRESGVHRLVRVSPFSAKKLRHTSFCMVEVIPKFKKGEEFEIPESEIRVEFSKSSGPGGQNVNKRETAVRVVHIPTGITAHSDSERSQATNRDNAMDVLRGKIYKYLEEERIKKVEGMYISKTTSAEWGNQIRSYVLHPYRMVKDHRTGVEERDVDKVLKEGEIGEFILAERSLEK